MQKNARLYPRLTTDLEGLTYVSCNGIPIGRIRLLSYGGMQVTPTSDALRLAVENRWAIPQEVEIHLFGKSMNAKVEVRSMPSREIGYRFLHEESSLLPFLKSILSPIEWGKSHLEHEGSKTPAQIQWLGADSEGILDFCFTYSLGKLKYQLSKTGCDVITYHNVGPGGVLTQMQPTPELDQQILRTTLGFLTGLCDGNRQSPYAKPLEFLAAYCNTSVVAARKKPLLALPSPF